MAHKNRKGSAFLFFNKISKINDKMMAFDCYYLDYKT